MDDNEEEEYDDLDPDKIFYNPIINNITQGCKYYSIPNLNSETSKQNQSQLALLSMNIRSLPKNYRNFKTLLENIDTKFDVITLTETWIKTHNADIYQIDGYSHEYQTRENKAGGGVAIFIKDHINYKTRSDLNYNTHEYQLLWLELDKNDTHTETNIIIGSIYRQPGSDPQIFNNILSDTLEKIENEKKEVIHTGDYNLDLLKHDSHIPTNSFIDLNFAQSFIPLISKPTRVTKDTASLIDNIFTNTIHKSPITNGIIITDISDHFPIIYIKYSDQNTVKKKHTS